MQRRLSVHAQVKCSRTAFKLYRLGTHDEDGLEELVIFKLPQGVQQTERLRFV